MRSCIGRTLLVPRALPPYLASPLSHSGNRFPTPCVLSWHQLTKCPRATRRSDINWNPKSIKNQNKTWSFLSHIFCHGDRKLTNSSDYRLVKYFTDEERAFSKTFTKRACEICLFTYSTDMYKILCIRYLCAGYTGTSDRNYRCTSCLVPITEDQAVMWAVEMILWT